MSKKKEYKAIIELYVDDMLYKAVSEDEWDNTLNELNDILRSKGYHKQWDDMPGFKHPSSYVHVWINWNKKKIVTVCHKSRTIFRDKNGYVLYEDDFVEYDHFQKIQSPFNAHPFYEGYYLREYLTHEGMCSRVRDTDIDESNIEYITKIRDVINFPKRYWNTPKKLDMSKL